MILAAVSEAQVADIIDVLGETRRRTLALVGSLSDQDLERVHSKLMSPLVWDLGHIAAFEDLWLGHHFARLPLLRAELADVYDAFETPRAERGALPFLTAPEARRYLEEVRARTLELTTERGVSEIHELVIRHEQQHDETMLQTLHLAHLDGLQLTDGPEPGGPARSGGQSKAWTGLELVEVPAGPCTIGAPTDGFAYDNERPRHRADVPGYLIGRTPVTNGSFLEFIDAGGYERRQWWSDEGWAFKEQSDVAGPAGWTADLAARWRLDRLAPLDPDEPVIHVSWFEADAFARAHGARLPTEVEWEKAATWDEERASARPYPWGEQPPHAGVHANVDQLTKGPVPVGAHPDGASYFGCLGMIGDVWEWTSSSFVGYPGFAAHPYPEYSEVFFGEDYKVLRGGSWATRPRVITPTFRNWDYPQRRQIFSGFRIARDL